MNKEKETGISAGNKKGATGNTDPHGDDAQRDTRTQGGVSPSAGEERKKQEEEVRKELQIREGSRHSDGPEQDTGEEV